MVEDRTDAATNRRWVAGATVITLLLLGGLLFRTFQLQVLQGNRHKQNLQDRSLLHGSASDIAARALSAGRDAWRSDAKGDRR